MSENVVQDIQAFVDPLLRLCREAGQRICSHYHAPEAGQYQSKDDNSPLTRADLESHALLLAGLQALAPSIPVLSEESSPAECAGRRSWGHYWLVDPLDGTKEFLARTGEFTINIALISGHRPVLGILYVPLTGLAYVGIPGGSALRYRYRGDNDWSSELVSTRALAPDRELLVLASRRHGGPRLEDCLQWLRQHWGPVSRLNSGSALKFCQLAEGAGDFYPRFSPCCEWDTAAGQAVLEAAGGALVGLDGEPLRYNCRESLLNPHFYAIADAHHPLWRQLLGRTEN
jgi:3'(2'), 5'-bisphosphate nucleotidase